MQDKTTDNEHLIDVKKSINGKEKLSVVDVRDMNWEKISGNWENDAGWQPATKSDLKKLEKWIEKSSTPIKETPLAVNPQVEESWKQVVEEQKKTEQAFLKKAKLTPIKSEKEPKHKKSHKWLLIYSVASAIGAISLGIVYLKLVPNINESKKLIDSSSESPLKNESPKKDSMEIMDSNKAYFMKYIIEESLWRAKVKASLYAKAEGSTTLKGLKDYANINGTAIEVINTVNKMFEKFGKESTLSINDLKDELNLLEKALKSEEDEGKKILCYLTKSENVWLGSYPNKKVAQRANKEKWISPLGALHEDTTGKSHRNRYPTDPNDPRSVGEPVRWKPLPNQNGNP
jgi:hypothetical protein